jgi:hypothetical protein
MKQTILRYGLYGAAILLGINVTLLLVFGVAEPENYKTGEIIGYTAIVLSLIFVFLGIKHYRDQVNNGKIRFWKAVILGLGIALLPSLAFAIYNYAYCEWIDPSFTENYMNHFLAEAQSTMSAVEFEEYKSKFEGSKSLYMNSAFQSFIMFITVLLIGLVVSVLSSFILKKD